MAADSIDLSGQTSIHVGGKWNMKIRKRQNHVISSWIKPDRRMIIERENWLIIVSSGTSWNAKTSFSKQNNIAQVHVKFYSH